MPFCKVKSNHNLYSKCIVAKYVNHYIDIQFDIPLQRQPTCQQYKQKATKQDKQNLKKK